MNMRVSKALPELRAPGPGQALRVSWALFRQRPFSALSIALALLTSLFAVCCGLGVFAAPWFMCELFALQISCGTGRDSLRTRAWLWAGVVQLLAVLVLCSLALLTLLALGPDVLFGAGVTHTMGILQSLGLLLGAGGLALVLVVHFEHAPSILIDRGGSLSFALLESARLVSKTGVVRNWLTTGFAHSLQLAPMLAATIIAVSQATLASTVIWGLIWLPVIALCVALGQGMVVAGYLALRDEVTAPTTWDARNMPSGRGVLLWLVLLGLVMLGPALASGALLRPARVQPGTLPSDARLVLDVPVELGAPHETYLPDTALRLSLSAQRVQVLASDGGGAGTLPTSGGRIRRVRVARALPPEQGGPRELAFAIELQREHASSLLTWIDDTGVRLDDSLGARFDQRLSGAASLALLACLIWTALWMALALPRQADLRRQLAAAGARELARAFDRRALRSACWLLPAALLSSSLGWWAALR